MNYKDLIKACFPLLRRPLKVLSTILDFVDKETYEDSTALEQLNNIHNDSHGSCIISRYENKYEYEYDLDIIIPCYNVESYVTKCIDSILEQKTSYNYRVIIVDDGSRDNTSLIIDNYSTDNRVLIIHKENGGLSSARNAGIKLLNSKYVMFVDSDDILEENAVEKLLSLAYKTNKKMINGNYIYIDENDDPIRLNSNTIKEGIASTKKQIPGFAWGKIYDSSIFCEIGFPEGYWYEDTLFKKIICSLCEDCYNTESIVYKYRYRKGSITHIATSDKRNIDSLYVFLQLHKDAKSLGLNFHQSDYEYMMEHIIYTAFRNKTLPLRIQKNIFTVWRIFMARENNGFSCEDSEYRDLEECLVKGYFWRYLVICVFHL